MNCLQAFLQNLKKYHLPGNHKKCLLAVSGGLDSVVLCQLSKEANLSFAIAHCNFGLRGDESERDETFVKSLGSLYGVTVYVKKFETEGFAEEQRLSIVEAA